MTLDTLVFDIFRLKLPQKKALEKLGIRSIRDLLYYFPTRHQESAGEQTVNSLAKGDYVLLTGKLSHIKTARAFRTKIPLTEATFTDATGDIRVVWFHQAYIGKMYADGDLVRLTGKVGAGKNGLLISNPEIEKASSADIAPAGPLFGAVHGAASFLYPVYPETRGVTSRFLFHAIQKVLASGILETLVDPLPPSLRKKYNLPELPAALVAMHAPRTESATIAARKRFAFEEVFYIQLARMRQKRLYEKNRAYAVVQNEEVLSPLKKTFPFELTSAQQKAVTHILRDLQKDSPMMRLLEGDVGSGKTAVAALAAYAVINTATPENRAARLQVAYMAPTEILARQHFESFIQYFKHTNINIGLITSSEARKFPSKISPEGHTHISKAQLIKWSVEGTLPILIGTHSLIQDKVRFKNLALAIIDEQHRFGVRQRRALAKKGEENKGKFVPHLLSMTATPIPRTLALTLYGDLDLTLLTDMPAGRKSVITEIIGSAQGRTRMYSAIREELKDGRQAYVICPRIDEPDPEKALAILAKSATQEALRLQKEEFKDFKVGLVHGKLKPKDKEEVMNAFAQKKYHILVATSVIEVGVNVPNATVIVIEGAERFGLAQLHQLRGRVLRSNHQAYCYLLSGNPSKKSTERLTAIKTAKNGFELAELDLKLRGEGSLTGTKQWGFSDVGMEAIKNLKMVEAARTEAHALIEEDTELKKYPALYGRLTAAEEGFHWE
jgi:ATP-dependent DNA helicase RecG